MLKLNKLNYLKDLIFLLNKGFKYLKEQNPSEFRKFTITLLSLLLLGLSEGIAVYSFMLVALMFSNPDFLIQNFSEVTFVGNYLNYFSYIDLIVISILLIIFANLLSIFSLKRMVKAAFSIGSSISLKLFSFYLHEDLISFQRKRDSEKIKDIVNAVDKAIEGVIVPHAQLVVKFVGSLFIIIFLLFLDYKVTIFAFLYLALIVAIYYRFHKDKISHVGSESNLLSADRIQHVLSSLMLKREINIYKAQPFFQTRYSSILSKYIYNETKRVIIGFSPKYVLEIVAASSIIFLGWLSVLFGYSLEYVLPITIVYLFAGYRMIPFFHNIFTTIASSIYFSSLIKDLAEQLEKFETAEKIQNNSEKLSLQYKGSPNLIKLKNVSLSYGNKRIFSNLNLLVKKGESLLIFGESGSGKTSLINIISGLVKPESGSVDHILTNKKKFISYVPQSIVLIPGTIRENILFGDEFDSEDFEKAITFAACRKFIQSLPDKENSVIGSSGIQLSGGQAQRVGIARALYKKSEILILDEATASLDQGTEDEVLNSIFKLDVTVIMISHNANLRDRFQNILDFSKL